MCLSEGLGSWERSLVDWKGCAQDWSDLDQPLQSDKGRQGDQLTTTFLAEREQQQVAFCAPTIRSCNFVCKPHSLCLL